MGTAVHDATGRNCQVCGIPFEKHKWHGRITEREGKFIVFKIVCKDCHNKKYEEGE